MSRRARTVHKSLLSRSNSNISRSRRSAIDAFSSRSVQPFFESFAKHCVADEREHSRFEPDFGARNEPRELFVRQDRAFLPRLAGLRCPNRRDGVVFDRLGLACVAEESVKRATNLAHRRASQSLRGSIVE